MKRKTLCLLFWGITSFLFSQNTENKIITFLSPYSAHYITADILGNLYLLQGSSLYKMNENGEILATYTRFIDGDISSIDVSNPLKIMLFYKETSTVVFLDDKLSLIGQNIDLMNNNLIGISLAAYSTDNKIWLYDYLNKNVIILDVYFNASTGIPIQVIDFEPIQLIAISASQYLLLNPNDGIYILSAFGNLVKKIEIKTEKKLQIFNNHIFYMKNNMLYQYDLHRLEETSFFLPEPYIADFVIVGKKIFYIDKKGRVKKFER
jgi:WD40 repeat protein